MNWIDAILVAIVLLSMWAGWVKGFINGLTDVLVWGGSLLAGFLLYQYTGNGLEKMFPKLGVWVLPLAFLLTIIISRILLSLLFSRLARQAPATAHQSLANKIFGLVPGCISGCIYAAVTAALLLSIPVVNGITKAAQHSGIANSLGVQVAWLDEKFTPIFGAAAKQTANKLLVKPDSSETVELHYTTTNVKPRAGLEADMLVLVNQERAKSGLAPVVADPELTLVARAHSMDMFARGYFSHYTPEKKDPFDRMRKAGIKFKAAGENLALGRTLKICHEGLMNSPGHRANILNGDYGRLGIGIIDGGIYGLMISQEFRN